MGNEYYHKDCAHLSVGDRNEIGYGLGTNKLLTYKLCLAKNAGNGAYISRCTKECSMYETEKEFNARMDAEWRATQDRLNNGRIMIIESMI